MIVQTQVLRPGKIFPWIALPVILLYWYIIITQNNLSVKNLLVGSAGILITGGSFLLNRSRIILDNDGITHIVFNRKNVMLYKSIVYADLVTHYHGHGFSVMWQIKTDDEIHSFAAHGKANRRKMAEALAIKLPSSKLGERVIKLAEGKRVVFF